MEEECQEPVKTAPPQEVGAYQDPWRTDSGEDHANLTMSALEKDVGLCGGDDQVAQEQPSQGQVGTTAPPLEDNHEKPHTLEAEFGLDESWEEFVNAMLDIQEAEELVETGQNRLVPGMGMETSIWGDLEGSWENPEDQSYCHAGTNVPEKEDDKIEKEDDLGQTKDNLGQVEVETTPPGAMNGILSGSPTSGGSDDQDCQGQDTLQRVEMGGTSGPERLVTSTLLECGDVMDRLRGLSTTSESRVSQNNPSVHDNAFDEMSRGDEVTVPEMPGTPSIDMLGQGRVRTIVDSEEDGIRVFRANLGVFAISTPVPSSRQPSHYGTDNTYQYFDNNNPDISDGDPVDHPDSAMVWC